jgi:signal transduction histidine kinase
MSRRWLRWGGITLFWAVEGVLYGTTFVKPGVHFADAVRAPLVGALMWIPISVWEIWLAEHRPLERGRIADRLGVHVASVAGVVLVRALAMMALNPWVGWFERLPSFGQILIVSARSNILLYILILGAAHALHFARRAQERELHAERLEAQITEAKLSALRSQLHPHFLFNALGAIAELMHRDVDTADRMIVRLSRLLRLALDEANTKEVTLAHELGCLEPYLELEKLRLGDRLSVTMDIEPAAREALMPGMMLQPLVENAIRHGIAPRTAPGTVAIRARRDGEALLLEVEDDGAGLAVDAANGVGLSNTRARLRELYGSLSTLELDGGPGRGTRVRVSVPQAGEAA